MAEGFTPIQTQEEFDNALKDRLARERETVRKQYADYGELKTLNETLTKEKAGFEEERKKAGEELAALQKKLTEAENRAKQLEKDGLRTDIAIEKGLPLELRSRLTGETKEDIEKDADSLLKIFKAQNNLDLPKANPEGTDPKASEENAAFKGMLSEMKLGGNE